MGRFVFICTSGADYGVAAIELAASNSPPDCCIELFESPAVRKNKREMAKAISLLLNCFDNNDTVSNSFIWFHSKNETIKREVKLSFGTETMLTSLSNWNLFNR